MNVVASSGWLEYLADGPNADLFAPVIENVSDLLVPTPGLYEVFKRVFQQRGERDALQALGAIAIRITGQETDSHSATETVYCRPMKEEQGGLWRTLWNTRT